jgi:hypothetical protein
MTHRVRPLVATRFTAAENRPVPGRYDEVRQVRLAEDGRPVVEIGPVGETITAVEREPSDPSEPSLWMLETETRVPNDDPDDRSMMAETETKVASEPADAGLLPALTLPADDSVTGIVAF